MKEIWKNLDSQLKNIAQRKYKTKLKLEKIMGTRALIYVKDSGRTSETIATIYTQCDGYPLNGIGEEIFRVLSHGEARLVNGYQMGQNNPKFFNGMGCLAAYLVCALKVGIGGIYLYPPNTTNVGEEYIYTIFEENGVIKIDLIDDCHHKMYSSPLSDAMEMFRQHEKDCEKENDR